MTFQRYKVIIFDFFKRDKDLSSVSNVFRLYGIQYPLVQIYMFSGFCTVEVYVLSFSVF